MRGNLHVRFLGEGAAATPLSYPTGGAGIDDNFMKSLGETLKPDSAALCVLIRQMEVFR